MWDARGCLANARGSRSEASIWAADLADPHWKRGMLGTATLSVPLGVFGHGSRKNPTNAKLLTISARRFKRVDVCVEINRCVGCTRQFFTKSFLGDDAAVLVSRRWRGGNNVP